MKTNIFIFHFLFHIIFSYCQNLDKGEITALPEGGGRWRFPLNCRTSCHYVEWVPQAVGNELFMKFTIKGQSDGYVAIAISADKTMGNDDAYICSRDSAYSTKTHIKSAHLTGFTSPVIDADITKEEGSSSILTENHLSCSFYRPFNVTKTIGGRQVSWNIATFSYYLLYAEGMVNDDGVYLYHFFSGKTKTPNSISLVANDDESKKMYPEPESLINLNLSIPVDPADTIFQVPNNGGLWLVPNDHCPKGACKSIQWELVVGPNREPMVQFTIQGSNEGWIGVAISRDKKMGNDDCYYCARESSNSSVVQVTSAYLEEHSQPIAIERVHQSHVYLAAIENNLMICRFLRPINVTKTIGSRPVTWDLSKERFNLFYAEGKVSEDTREIFPHSVRQTTHSDIYLLSNKGYKTINPFKIWDESNNDSSSANQLKPSLLPEENVEMSPSGGGRWTFPTGCNDSCRSLEWEPLIRNKADAVKITISGAGHEYVGFLITTKISVAKGDCYFCIRDPIMVDQVVIKSGFCSPDEPPANLRTIPLEQIIHAEASDNMLSCAFYRPLSVSKMVSEEVLFYNLAQTKYSLIYEEGNLINEQGVTVPNFNVFTPFPFTLVNTTLFRRVQGKTASNSKPLVIAKGSTGVRGLYPRGGSVSSHFSSTNHFYSVLFGGLLLFILNIILC